MNKSLKVILIILATPIIGLLFFALTFFSAGLWSDLQFAYPLLLKVSGELIFLGIIAIFSWLVWKSKKLHESSKAIFSIIPTATVLAIIAGLNDGRWNIELQKLYFFLPIILYLGYIGLLYKAKKSWIYYYAATLVILVISLSGIFGLFSPN